MTVGGPGLHAMQGVKHLITRPAVLVDVEIAVQPTSLDNIGLRRLRVDRARIAAIPVDREEHAPLLLAPVDQRVAQPHRVDAGERLYALVARVDGGEHPGPARHPLVQEMGGRVEIDLRIDHCTGRRH